MFPIIRNGYEVFYATIDEDNLVKVYSVCDEDEEEEEATSVIEDPEEQDSDQGEDQEHGNSDEQEDVNDQEPSVIEDPWSEYKFDEKRVGDLRITVKATTLFKGLCTCEDFPERKHQNCCYEVWHNCNSLLLRLEDLSYMLVCGDTGILQFHTKNDEEIVSFTSRMGPNGVCYPLAATANHFYILLERKVVPLSFVNRFYKCPYDAYFAQEKEYRTTVKNINWDVEDNRIGEKMENVRELLDDDE
jgi:hypothetical protein